MKKLFIGGFAYLLFCFFSTILTLSVTSCSEDDSTMESIELNKRFEIKNLENKMSSYKNLNLKNSNSEEIKIGFERYIHNESISLIKSYGITEKELILEFGSLDAPEISIVALALVEAENKISKENQFGDVFFNKVVSGSVLYAQSDTIGGCLVDAVGISALAEVVKGNITKSAATKLVKKIAGRTLGPIGAALAVYDFADCMGYI